MYSENQLAKIIADNVGKATSLFDGKLEYDAEGDVITTLANFWPSSITVNNFSAIEDEDGNTLQDALDGKSDKLYYHNIALSDESAENSIGIQLLTKDSTAYTKEQALDHLASFTGKNTELFYYYNSTTDIVYTDGYITNIRYQGGVHPLFTVVGFALDEKETFVKFHLNPDTNIYINFNDTVVPL